MHSFFFFFVFSGQLKALNNVFAVNLAVSVSAVKRHTIFDGDALHKRCEMWHWVGNMLSFHAKWQKIIGESWVIFRLRCCASAITRLSFIFIWAPLTSHHRQTERTLALDWLNVYTVTTFKAAWAHMFSLPFSCVTDPHMSTLDTIVGWLDADFHIDVRCWLRPNTKTADLGQIFRDNAIVKMFIYKCLSMYIFRFFFSHMYITETQSSPATPQIFSFIIIV